ncbi:MAG: DUF21 domain-containing protein [Methanophagales archaeon]|nr:DUF21 domain-containing protein [Methanophagales archaeon]
MLITIPVIVLLVLLSSFFAAAEMAFVSIDKLKVREESVKGRKNALLIEKLLENPDQVVSAIVIGNNLANITASILAGAIATSLVGNIGVGIDCNSSHDFAHCHFRRSDSKGIRNP